MTMHSPDPGDRQDAQAAGASRERTHCTCGVPLKLDVERNGLCWRCEAQAAPPSEPTLADRIRNEPALYAAYTLGRQEAAAALRAASAEPEADAAVSFLMDPPLWAMDAQERAAASAEPPKACLWSWDDGDWDTACGHRYCIIEGTPTDNRMVYCTYCGGVLIDADGGPDCECGCDGDATEHQRISREGRAASAEPSTADWQRLRHLVTLAEDQDVIEMPVDLLRRIAASAEPSGEPEPDGEAIWDFVDDGSLMIECTEDWKGVEMKMSAEVHRRIMDAIRVASRAAAPVSEPLLDVLETVTDALDDLKEAVRKANKMNGPEYMGLGYRVVKAIDLGRNRIALARRTPEATDG